MLNLPYAIAGNLEIYEYIFYVPEHSFMHVTVSACFLIRFALQCRFYLKVHNISFKKYYAPAHAQMQKKKRKVGGFLKKNSKPIENIFVNVQLKL